MNTTYIKKNTQVPTFEQVKNITIIAKWKNEVIPDILLFTDNMYKGFTECDWYKLLDWWTILTDEVEYCEWIKLSDKSENGHYETTCNHSFYGGKSNGEVLNFSFCPHCGQPIRIVKEVNPLALDGKLPIIFNSSKGYFAHYINNDVQYDLKKHATEREAITAWNEFVLKVTK